jgi:hypothetical protein
MAWPQVIAPSCVKSAVSPQSHPGEILGLSPRRSPNQVG